MMAISGRNQIQNGRPRTPTDGMVLIRKQQAVSSNLTVGSSFVSKFRASRFNCSSLDTLIDTLIDLSLGKKQQVINSGAG